MENGIFDKWASTHDIIFITETKSTFAYVENSALEGYTPFNSDLKAEKLFARTGLFVLVRDRLAEHIKVLQGSSEFVLWLHFKKDIFGRECIAGAVYLANESASYHNPEMFTDISNDIVALKARFDMPFILLGDFNARTGSLQDFFDDDGFFERQVGLHELEGRVDAAYLSNLC